MGTHNICFLWRNKKIFILISFLSRDMQTMTFSQYNMGNEEHWLLSKLRQIYAVKKGR